MVTIAQTNGGTATDFNGVPQKGVNLTTAFAGDSVTSATFYLSGSGQTGTISCAVISADGTNLGSLGSLDASTLAGSFTAYTFNTTSVAIDSSDQPCLMMVVPSTAGGTQFEYSASGSPQTTYSLRYATTIGGVPQSPGTANYPKFSADISAVVPSSGGTRLPPPPIVVHF